MFDDQLPPLAATPSEPHRALYLRWRPKRFADVVGQEHVTRTLRNAVKLGRPSHAYLFTGPRGTGKTSVARILYRAANCQHAEDGDPCNSCPLCRAALDGRAMDLVEIDAASNRGIDDMRDLREKVAYRPGDGTYRVYIIDEAHELTREAADAFLKTLEEPPPHAIFVLATTEAHKIKPTIVSRCQRFDFRRIPFQLTREQLQRVAESEGMQIDPAVIERLALVARGGLRDALSLLDQLESFAGGHVDMAVARAALSLPSIEAVRGVLDGMTRRDPSSVMAFVSDAADGGADLRIFAEELVFSLRALLLLRTGADVRLTDELPEDEVAWLKERAPAWSVGTLMRLVQTLSDALARTRDTQQFQVQTEVALLTACDVESLSPVAVTVTPRLAAASEAGSPASAPPPPASASPLMPGRPRALTLDDGTPPSAHGNAGASDTQPPRLQAVAAVAPPTAPVAAPPVAATPLTAEPAQASALLPSAESSAPSARGSSEPSAAELASPAAEPPPAAAEAHVPPAPPARQLPDTGTLTLRWPDVIEQVKGRNSLLGSTLGSAQPLAVEDNVLTVAFATEFNRKSADKAANRELIESAIKRVYGAQYRLRCTVSSSDAAGPSLLDDPVINYATRTFGGQPKRVTT